MNLLIRKNTEQRNRGSLTVEASIMLPIFLVAMLTLGIIIRMVGVSENITHSLTDELGIVAADGQLPTHSLSFKSELTKRIEDENGSDITSAEVAPYLYRIPYYSAKSGKMYLNLIGATAVSGINLGLPNIFGISPKVSTSAICRAFTGAASKGDKMPFSELEDGGDGKVVWVFPRAGEKYHTENCSVIKNLPREMLLTPGIKGAYTPCELCKPNTAGYGTLVYIFASSGKAYHLGSCFIVERYVISMDKKDATDKGYTACSKCGGGD